MRKFILIFVIGVLFLTLIFQITLAQKTEKPNEAERLQAVLQTMDPKNELVHLRALNRRTFKKNDGKVVTFISTEPLNYVEDDNQLYPIDINLISEIPGKTNKTGSSKVKNIYRHHAWKNSIKAQFADASDGGVHLEYQKHSVEFVLEHQNKRQAVIEKNKVRYKKVLDNCDLVYTVLPGQVKDELIFSSIPKTAIISYKLNMNQKLTPQNGEGGSIDLIDDSGKTVFHLLPAIMYEQDNNNKYKPVETKFHWNKNELYCDMILDMSWLKDKKRQYPIVVDPIVNPAPTSNGDNENRTLIHCPEAYGKIKCTISLDGPGFRGELSSHKYAHVYFKDKTANKVFLQYHEANDYHPDPFETDIQADHDYEVYLLGGKTSMLFGGTYTGQAWATVEYGGDNGNLFAEISSDNHFSDNSTGNNSYVLLKSVYIKYPQTIKYKYVLESTNGNISLPLIPYFRINPGPNVQLGSGEIRLNPGYYQLELSPSNCNHYRIELDFPFGTGNYEKRIVMRTNPGSIESTFMLPSSGDVLLQYHTIQNGSPSSEAFPNIKIASGSETPVYNKNFPLDSYNIYDGGDKAYLQKEKLYTLTISRGRCGGSGWGGLNLDLFYLQNDTDNSHVDQIQLIDKNGIPITNNYAGDNNQLRFHYVSADNHTLKSFKLSINDQEYQFNNLNANNGWVNIPYSINDFKLNSGTTFNCQVEVYDGFDFFTSALENYTVDSTPPVINNFSGEVVNKDGKNSINLVCEAEDGLSSIQAGEISWKINDQPGGTLPWNSLTEPITDLPNNAKVEITFSVTDKANNTATLSKVFYTYPEKSDLYAPLAIYTTKPGKFHPTLKFTKTDAPEYRIQRYQKRDALPDLLEYDTGFMPASSLSTVTILPPGLNIISPSSGSSFGRPAFVTLTAFSDTDYDIYKVDFYANGTLIGKDTSNPFSFLWSNMLPGDYILTAVATDTDGTTQTSAPVTITVTNISPTVRIVTPVSGTSYSQPGNIYIRVEASDSDSDISKVELYNGDALIGTLNTSPYSTIWNNVMYGNYTLSAKAIDSDGAVSISDPVTVIVTNVKPTVTITSPTMEYTYTQPATVTINATASDSDGSVSSVDFYEDEIRIGSDNSSPFSCSWSNATVGRHALKVKAVDNNGAETWSDPVYINVIQAPDDMWYGLRTVANGLGTGYWGTFTISDNVNSSGVQWFFSDDINYEKLSINGKSIAVQGDYTTYYWVPRNVSLVTSKYNYANYARTDDNFTLYLNGVVIFSQGFSGNIISSNPINMTLVGGQWNQVTFVDDNSGGNNYEVEFAHNFKYLIQQALNSSGGGTVYMSSLTNTSSSLAVNNTGVSDITGNLTEQRTITSQSTPMLSDGENSLLLQAKDATTQTNQEYYSYIDLLPADPHKTYVYRITTRNGDKTAKQDSDTVSVMNNAPEISGVEPNPGTKSYSNGAFSIKVTDAHDYDGDTLNYFFRITGPVNMDSTNLDPHNREFIVNNLPDGTYTWTVTVSDYLNADDTATGTFVVDKNIPTALFSMNNSALYTTSQIVSMKVTDASDGVDMIRISKDKINWTLYFGSNQTINWPLTVGDGKKIVYLQAHKPEGDVWGPVVERSIILDTTPPEITTLHISNEGGDGKVTFHWIGGSDSTSELSGKLNIQRWENGDWVTYQTDYQENKIEIPATGYNTSVKIRLQLIDKAGQISDWSTPSEGFTKAASGSFNKAETVSGFSVTDGHYLDLKLNQAEGAVKYKIECVQNPGGGDTAFVSGGLTYKDTGILARQTYYYKVLTYNSNDEITDVDPEKFTITNIPPVTPVEMGPKGLLNQKEGLVFNFDQPLEMLDPDGDSLTVTYHLSTDGQNYHDLSTNILTNLSEGVTYWWKATIDDHFGGVTETEPISFSIDMTAPSIMVDNLSTDYKLAHQVQINVSDSGSGVKTLKINGIITTNLNSEITFNTQGANYLEVEATDQAGNTSTFSHTYYVDQEPPSCTNIHFVLPDRNGTYLSSSNIVPVIWNAVDLETGVAKFTYTWSGDPNVTKEFSQLGDQGTYNSDIIGNFVDGQTYYLNLQAQNYLGLISPVIQSSPVLYDHTGPVLTIGPLLAGDLFNGVRYIKSLQQLSLTVNASDPHTGTNKIEYALVDSPITDNNTQWFNSLMDLQGNIKVTDGKVYYLAVQATNGTNLTNTVFSEPIVIDASEPSLMITTQPEQKDNQAYLAQVAVTDPDTMVVKVEYGIGTENGSTNLSKGLPGADEGGWITVTYPSDILELRQYADIPIGTTYFFTVKATNITGITTVKTSLGTKVINSSAPVVRDDGNYTSDNTTLYFEWSFPNNPRPIKDYQYQIRLKDGTLIRDWQAALGLHSVTVKGLSLINNTCYYCDVQALYEDGSVSEIGTSDGILVDITAPEITTFNLPKFAGGGGIDLTWAANDPESGVKCYAGIGLNPGETGVTKGWVNLGNLRKFRLSQDITGNNIEFIHKQKYYVSIMVQNGAGLAVQQTGPAVLIDLTPPDAPIVIDEGNYTNRDDQLKFSWKWPIGDSESGIREYWITLTTQQSISGSEQWYTGLQVKDILLHDLELIQGGIYYLAVKAINNAGAENIGFSDGILIDTTAPTPPVVIDYGDYSLSKTALDVDMIASDALSGVAGYTLSLGTMDNPKEVISNQQVLPDGNKLNLNSLNLNDGKIYYFTVSATDNAGNESMKTLSDGIMVDSMAPKVQYITAQGQYQADSDTTQLIFNWIADSSPSGIIDAQYAISSDPNGTNLSWQSADLWGSQILTGLNLEEGKTYYVFVRVQNRAFSENPPYNWSVSGRSNPILIDKTPPEILSIETPALMGKHFLLHWEARDNISGISEYRYAVGSYPGGTDVTDGWVSEVVNNEISFSRYRDDLPLQDNQSYYIAVMAKNAAGLWSPVYKSSAIKTDLSAPTVSKLEYGSSYININDLKNGLRIEWAANDEPSGIAAYRIKLVTAKDNKDLDAPVVLTNETSGTIYLNNLNIQDGMNYFIAFQAQNSLSTWSQVCYSDAILVDITAPVLSIKNQKSELVTNDGQLEIPYEVSESSSVAIKLEYPLGRKTGPDFIRVNGQAIYKFDPQPDQSGNKEEGTYILILTPTDIASNPGIATQQKIRLNAKPKAVIGPDQIITKGVTIHFNPEVSDTDGSVQNYRWDFGNGTTSIEAKPSCTYTAIGSYTVTLKVQDNDLKWSDEAKQIITVTNTCSGELLMDEDWDGSIIITGDILVPQNKTLTIKAGTMVDFSGNYQIRVLGKILIAGIPTNPITIGGTTAWNGIRLEQADPSSQIKFAIIQGASVGVVLYQTQIPITICTFRNNRIGLHILGCNPVIQNCFFVENQIYGVKEDSGASPTVIGCIFSGNTMADYYEDQLAIISIDTLNQQSGNRDNSKQ